MKEAPGGLEASAPGADLPDPFKAPVGFDILDAASLHAVTSEVIERCRQKIDAISSLPFTALDFENTFNDLDRVYSRTGTLYSIADLLANVHANEEVRVAARASLSAVARFFNGLQLNASLYRVLKSFSADPAINALPAVKTKFIDDVIRSFERNGLSLDLHRQVELRSLRDRLSDLEIEFSNNIESYHDELFFTEEEVAGLPADYLSQRRQPDGTYCVDLSYPSYHPFMKLAHSDTARKRLYERFCTRAGENKEILKKILGHRKQMAGLLGFDSYAAYSLDDKMARTTDAVWNFEYDLVARTRQKAAAEHARLTELLNLENSGKDNVVHPWQSAFLLRKMIERDFGLDQEALKEYFEIENVLQGIFGIVTELFGLTVIEAPGVRGWHQEVRVFELRQNDVSLALLYTDLFPRKFKYGHAACFDITAGRSAESGYNMPSAAVVCNFPRPTQDTPSLLTHYNVITLFHEFGHALHHLLTESPLHYFSGTRVAADFVEVPSQLFENWAWEYGSLRRFARHYKTGEVLPESIHAQMVASRNADSGLQVSQQLFYGILDMTYHDRFDPELQDTTDVVREIQNEISMYPFLEGTHMETSFGHLNGYAAGYYGYLWARVYADDMFGRFREQGLFNRKFADRLRHGVLAKGATEKEMDIVRGFLGREPRFEAFLEAQGINPVS